MPPDDTRAALDDLLRTSTEISTRDLATAAGVSRQAAQQLLRREVAAGRLVAVGSARATRYRPTVPTLVFALPNLEEDRVLAAMQDRSPALAGLVGNDRSLVAYAVTEMVNNAIDHSGGTQVVVAAACTSTVIDIRIEDDGEGAFHHFRRLAHLATPIEALQEISKGRATTDPSRHTGEGLFFTSKAVDRFELAAGNLRWVVDNQRGDQAVLEGETQVGTRVSLVVNLPVARTLADLFAAYTEEFAFTKTRTVVKLFELGTDFVSRSEARRLLVGLEKFREVLVDFTGVGGVGQGFADEVFRVWARAHPEVRLSPIHMNSAVAFLVGRALST